MIVCGSAVTDVPRHKLHRGSAEAAQKTSAPFDWDRDDVSHDVPRPNGRVPPPLSAPHRRVPLHHQDPVIALAVGLARRAGGHDDPGPGPSHIARGGEAASPRAPFRCRTEGGKRAHAHPRTLTRDGAPSTRPSAWGTARPQPMRDSDVGRATPRCCLGSPRPRVLPAWDGFCAQILQDACLLQPPIEIRAQTERRISSRRSRGPRKAS